MEDLFFQVIHWTLDIALASAKTSHELLRLDISFVPICEQIYEISRVHCKRLEISVPIQIVQLCVDLIKIIPNHFQRIRQMFVEIVKPFVFSHSHSSLDI